MNENRIRKLVIFSNCKDSLDTVSPCNLINELTIKPFIIEVIIVNIPCAKQSPDYDVNTLKCLSMDQSNTFITLHNSTGLCCIHLLFKYL